MSDPVNHPGHYQAIASCPHCGGEIEAIHITERFSFIVGNALKYLLRAGRKSGSDRAQDYAKAAWYASRAAQQARSADGSGATGPIATDRAPDTRHPVPDYYGVKNAAGERA